MKDKKYVMSKSELEDFLYNYELHGMVADAIKDFLKDKQPVEFLDRKEVEKIIGNNCCDFEWIILNKVSETPEQAFNRVTTQICNLAIREGGNNSQGNGY